MVVLIFDGGGFPGITQDTQHKLNKHKGSYSAHVLEDAGTTTLRLAEIYFFLPGSE